MNSGAQDPVSGAFTHQLISWASLVKLEPSEESFPTLLLRQGNLACHFLVYCADTITIVPKLQMCRGEVRSLWNSVPLSRTCCLALGGAPSPVKSGVGVLFLAPEGRDWLGSPWCHQWPLVGELLTGGPINPFFAICFLLVQVKSISS